MKSGFAHFDNSHQENFCASVLLLAMEVDEGVKDAVVNLVRHELGIGAGTPLRSVSREARLTADEDDNWARVDLCLLFEPPNGFAYAFVELKTHDRWSPILVAQQLKDQSERKVVRGGERRVLGAVLLAPERLCRSVQAVDPEARVLSWPSLLSQLRALRSAPVLTQLAIQHLEETMERPAGIDRKMTLADFEQATTTIACLRQFLVACIADISGTTHGVPLYMTPGDGKPRRDGEWAWHGLSVPFSFAERRKGRVGIYKYEEVPAGEESARESLWLEGYIGDADTSAAFVRFTPSLLSTKELDVVRARFAAEWKKRVPTSSGEPQAE
jgi:hypothetical protein